MPFIIHQALYGDSQGAYSLLDSSLADDIAKSICNVTDLLDRPTGGHLDRAIYRGFPFNGYYLFIKTFPDNDPNVRSGRVLSHVQIVELNDLELCADLSQIFNNFIHTADKEYKVGFTKYVHPIEKSLRRIESNSRAASVINEFKNNDHVTWVGEKDYLVTLKALWHGFPSTLRSRLKFGVAYDPRKLNENNINFNYIIEGSESRWLNSPCSLIRNNQVGSFESPIDYYLAGDIERVIGFVAILEKFNIRVTLLEDLDALLNLSNLYENMSDIHFVKLIYLCDLISNYCPDKNIASKEKSNVLNCMSELIPSIESKEILMLRSPDWAGFRQVSLILGSSISKWFDCILITNNIKTVNDEFIQALLSEAASPQWWTEAVFSSLGKIFNKWQPEYAVIFWEWMLVDSRIINVLEAYVPDSITIERSLVEAWQQPDSELAAQLRRISNERNWYDLHALAILRLYPAKECILIQVAFDYDINHMSALKSIADHVNSEDFIIRAIELGEIRLIKIAACKIQQQESLLNAFNKFEPSWVKLCVECVKLNINVWKYIGIQLNVIYSLFDQLIDGTKVERPIYESLIESGYDDISMYPQRAFVWKCFDKDTRDHFISKTALSCLKMADDEIVEISSLENEIFSIVANRGFFEMVVADSDISNKTIINLFDVCEDLNEDGLCYLINNSKFSTFDSRELGTLILNRNWKKSAEFCKNLKGERPDLEVAAEKCISLIKRVSTLSILKDIFNFTNNDLEDLRSKKFQVALSFPGEKRNYVKNIFDIMDKHLGAHRIFYDNNYKHQISRPDADTLLQEVYRRNSKLIVVFLCTEYEEKQWCGLEWRAIRDIIKNKDGQRIMLVRFDDQEIEGLFSIDGYVDGNAHDEKEMSELILHRLAILLEAEGAEK